MKVEIFHATAGHGHRKVAEALEAEGKRTYPEINFETYDSLDQTPSIFKSLYPGTYYWSVKHTPRIWGSSYYFLDHPWVYAVARPFRNLFNRFFGRKILQGVIERNPDVLISTHFLTAELFANAKKRGLIQSRLITVITDFLPHSFWINAGTDEYTVMCDETKTELVKRGVAEKHIHVTGIPIHPDFIESKDTHALKEKFGLEKGRLTLLLTSGSFGLGDQERILSSLEIYHENIQCLVVCGNNSQIYQVLSKQSFSYPVKVFGYVDFMADLMAISDMIVAKPGGSTATESLVRKLPMVIFKPIPGQESGNTTVLKSRQASWQIAHADELVQIVGKVVNQPEELEIVKSKINEIAKPDASKSVLELAIKG